MEKNTKPLVEPVDVMNTNYISPLLKHFSEERDMLGLLLFTGLLDFIDLHMEFKDGKRS